MKKSMNNFKKMAVALATVFTMGISNFSFATDPIEGKSVFQFIGNSNKQPVFQLMLSSTEATVYTVIVKDDQKTVLLKETLKGTIISRKYKLDVEELLYANGTTFEVTNKHTNETNVYTINTSNYAVEKVEIKKATNADFTKR